MENLKKRIRQIRKKTPPYGALLNFYQKIRMEQEKIRPSLTLPPVTLKKEWKELLKKEGFPLIEKRDFPIDMEVSIILFYSLCEVGKSANPHMAQQVKKIENALQQKRMDVKELVRSALQEEKVEQAASALKLDRKVLLFLAYQSIKPSIDATVEKLQPEVEEEAWLKGHCPICGSQPDLSLFKGTEGKRYLHCSFCGHEWRFDRMTCPFCMSPNQEAHPYFRAEGEEAYRIDACDACHQYIKTIDARAIDMVEPGLEDLATLHLDLLAIQKGYQRPVPNPWIS